MNQLIKKIGYISQKCIYFVIIIKFFNDIYKY